jgi:hypothetical protein
VLEAHGARAARHCGCCRWGLRRHRAGSREGDGYDANEGDRYGGSRIPSSPLSYRGEERTSKAKRNRKKTKIKKQILLCGATMSACQTKTSQSNHHIRRTKTTKTKQQTYRKSGDGSQRNTQSKS